MPGIVEFSLVNGGATIQIDGWTGGQPDQVEFWAYTIQLADGSGDYNESYIGPLALVGVGQQIALPPALQNAGAVLVVYGRVHIGTDTGDWSQQVETIIQ